MQAETKYADLSTAYKEQMWIFMGEIREFFNAGGLEDKLNDLKSKGLPHAEGIGLIDDFLAVKHGHDLGVKLTKLVAMRESLNAWVIAAPHGPDRQSVRFADVQVEQYAFVLLAEAAKIVEDQNHEVDWQFALSVAAAALDNGRLSESLGLFLSPPLTQKNSHPFTCTHSRSRSQTSTR